MHTAIFVSVHTLLNTDASTRCANMFQSKVGVYSTAIAQNCNNDLTVNYIVFHIRDIKGENKPMTIVLISPQCVAVSVCSWQADGLHRLRAS